MVGAPVAALLDLLLLSSDRYRCRGRAGQDFEVTKFVSEHHLHRDSLAHIIGYKCVGRTHCVFDSRVVGAVVCEPLVGKRGGGDAVSVADAGRVCGKCLPQLRCARDDRAAGGRVVGWGRYRFDLAPQLLPIAAIILKGCLRLKAFAPIGIRDHVTPRGVAVMVDAVNFLLRSGHRVNAIPLPPNEGLVAV